MVTIFQSDLDDIEAVLDKPTTFSLTPTNKKRWHMAVTTIYCSRAFSSLIAPNNETKTSPVSSSRVITIDVLEPHPYFPDIDQSSLTELVKEKKLNQLVRFDGVEGIASALKTNLDRGLDGDYEDISYRHDAFGANTYKRPPKKGFFRFVWESLRDPTILILLVCATLSLGFGIKEHGAKEGWLDGGSICVAVFLVIVVSAVSNFRQDRQFEKLSKVGNNISVDITRNGRRQKASIFEVVVGDIVCLNTGDQVRLKVCSTLSFSFPDYPICILDLWHFF
ncbi:calcium-transporting ATPase 12, plasma membrane-type-like [Actinidia eriantha]|uniref:calcium-transporting ATPase 12, plasma membrane-type-like n=1 Tax=Actinidia eriantha TaxID=165200 RepID=UPI00258C751A|nr:calcium-transporting ATPase 12, plasma membrane-type-like [Actinidia eriantha]